jgi:hypothetical protein
MKKSKFSESQIVAILKEGEASMPVAVIAASAPQPGQHCEPSVEYPCLFSPFGMATFMREPRAPGVRWVGKNG